MRVLMDPKGPFGHHGTSTDDVTDPLPPQDTPTASFCYPDAGPGDRR